MSTGCPVKQIGLLLDNTTTEIAVGLLLRSQLWGKYDVCVVTWVVLFVPNILQPPGIPR